MAAWPLPGLCPGLCPDLCLACLACLERSRRINASASCPTPRFAYTSPKPLQICFQMASFGHLSIRIWIRPFSKPETQSQSCGRFDSRWLRLDTFFVEIWIKPFPNPHTHKTHSRFSPRLLHSDTGLSRSGSSHFRTQIHLPKAIAVLFSDGLSVQIWVKLLHREISRTGRANEIVAHADFDLLAPQRCL